MIILFKYCANVENCESFKGFSYIYIYIDQLVIYASKSFHGLLKKAETMGDVGGVSICRNGPRLTHLLFAADRLIFYKVKENEC